MAEVFKTTDAGESAQHFVQFLMMFQQQALLAMGRHPKSPPGAPPANLDLAKAFILQLGAIRERTRGNLSASEQTMLETALSGLERTYAEVAPRP